MADVNAWDILSSEPKEPRGVLNDKIVMRFDRYLNWDLLSKHYTFNVELLRMYQHRVNWPDILQRHDFDESFLREMAPIFSPQCWEIISEHQTLSESFIHEFARKVHWPSIALYQSVSGKFLSEHVTFTLRDSVVADDVVP